MNASGVLGQHLQLLKANHSWSEEAKMSPISKRRSRPEEPDAFTELMDQLENLLEKEHLFTPNMQIASQPQEPGEVTTGARDGSVNVLRCLKMWYDLSSDVFLLSVNIVDRFLTKMKVRNKHLACISVSGLFIASNLLHETINPNDLVNISQSKCTTTDMQRMAEIMISKLNLDPNTVPTTALSFLRLYYKLFEVAARKLNLSELFHQIINEQELCMYLEIIACDSQCANYRPCLIALVLIYLQFQDFYAELQYFPLEMFELDSFTMELKNFCNIKDEDFYICHEQIMSVLNLYNGQLKVMHRQRLVWKVSNRTMRKLRPTKQLQYVLPTIDEDSNHSCNELVGMDNKSAFNN